MGLEKDIKVAEDKLRKAIERETASREATVLEAKQRAIDKFKESEEYRASQNYDVGYDNGYDKGVKEIFFNIWRKHRKVDNRILGKEYQQLMVD